MRYVLEQGSTKFGIEVETGAIDVSLKGDYISGTWLATPKVIRAGASRPVAVELLNSLQGVGSDRRPEVALKFTKRFGPLTTSYSAGLPFRFSIHDWVVSVIRLQRAWATISHFSREKVPIDIPLDLGECFRFAKDGLTFRTHRLDTFVALEIASVPAPRLCVCANHRTLEEAQASLAKGKQSLKQLRAYFKKNGCRTPYFIAGDGREKYCSERCAQAAQRRVKLEWWNKNRKGGEDGTQKTR